jgi:two-component system cell cycle response regulator DivK
MRALRSDPRTFRIPIIVLTAHANPDDVVEAMQAGCCAYETKPIVLRRLLERIAEGLKAAAPAG